jgi:hypothetical protein
MYGSTPQDPKNVKASEKFRNCVLELPGRGGYGKMQSADRGRRSATFWTGLGVRWSGLRSRSREQQWRSEQKALKAVTPNCLRKTQTRKGGIFTHRGARPIGGTPWLLGIASAACFGAPLGLACRLACVPQLLAPARCWCVHSGHLPLGAPTRRVERTSWPDALLFPGWAVWCFG